MEAARNINGKRDGISLAAVAASGTMKAVVAPRYGSPDVLQLEDLETPTPKDNEVLIKVHASSVNAGDWHLLRGDPWLVRLMMGLFKPKCPVLGADIAGTIVAVGPTAREFQVGDEVYADISNHGFAAFAEYACVPETILAHKPSNLSFEEAAAVPAAAVTALQGLRDHGGLVAGQKVLIHGASGGVGSFAVQIAKALGAEVTGVCSTKNVEMVRDLGADHVIDYTKEDFAENGQQYDLILAVGGARSIFDYKRALAPTGTYVLAGGEMRQFFQALLLGPILSRKAGKKLTNYLVKPNQADLVFLKGLIEEGRVAPSIDKRFSLAEVPDAIRYLEDGHPHGKIVITI